MHPPLEDSPGTPNRSWWSRKPSGPAVVALVLWSLFTILAGALQGNPALRSIACIASCVAYTMALILGERALMKTQDELQQKIRLEALAWAWPISIGTIMLAGMLQSYGLISIDPRFMFLPGLLSFFATLAWSRRRYP